MSSRSNFFGLSLRDLDILRRLLNERSVSRVASQLGQSQPSVSATLRRLRDIFGDPLLVRSGQRMVLTDKGMMVSAHVEELVNGFVELLESDETFDPATSERTIRIAAATSFEFFLVPHLISELHKIAPRCRLELFVPTLQSGVETGRENGGLDAIVGNWPVPPQHLKHMPLASSELACLVCATHPLPAGTRLTLEEYVRLNHISPSSQQDLSISPIEGMLLRHGLERRVVVSVPDYSIIPQLLPGTDYAFTVGRRYAEHAARDGTLKHLVMPEELSVMAFYLLWHERSQSSRYHRWLRETIRRLVRERDVLAVPEASLIRARL
ncbi:LysR family transcriptional regulator [Devosia sp. 2618]|uniref:LysR family transcriptional regulator n=1 Tax=Devosia sp. 2618 TaxID=3156454 RepID=UPI003392A310